MEEAKKYLEAGSIDIEKLNSGEGVILINDSLIYNYKTEKFYTGPAANLKVGDEIELQVIDYEREEELEIGQGIVKKVKVLAILSREPFDFYGNKSGLMLIGSKDGVKSILENDNIYINELSIKIKAPNEEEVAKEKLEALISSKTSVRLINHIDRNRRIKSSTLMVQIIFLTALDEEVNLVLGLEIGGDDYITKPFRVRELLARVKALLRRNSKTASSGSKLVSGNILVDTSSALVKKNGKELTVTAQEYKLLLIFMRKPSVTIKRNDLLGQLTEGVELFFDENTLSVYIKRLREKIEDNPKEPEYIVTQRGLGYKWNKAVDIQ